MPLLNNEQKVQVVQAHGLDPAQWTVTDDGTELHQISTPTVGASLPEAPAPSVDVAPQAPTGLTPTQTFIKSAINKAPAMVGTGIGASLTTPLAIGLAPETFGASLLLPLVTGYLGGKGVSMAQDAITSDEYKKEVADAEAQNPKAAIAAELATLPLGGFSPSPTKLVKAGGALGKLVTGLKASPEELSNLMEVGIGTGIGTAMPLVQGETDPNEILRSVAEGALYNSPNRIGKILGFHPAEVRQSQQSDVAAEMLNKARVAPPAQPAVEVSPTGSVGKPDVSSTIGGIPFTKTELNTGRVPVGNIQFDPVTGEIVRPKMRSVGKVPEELQTELGTQQSELDAMTAEGGLGALGQADIALKQRIEELNALQRQMAGNTIGRPEVVEGKTPFPPFAKANKATATDVAANEADLAGRQTEQELAGIKKNRQDKYNTEGLPQDQEVLTPAAKSLIAKAQELKARFPHLDVSRITPEFFNMWARDISALHGVKVTANPELPTLGVSHFQDGKSLGTSEVNLDKADAGTPGHEDGHHIWSSLSEGDKAKIVQVVQPELDAFNAERAAFNEKNNLKLGDKKFKKQWDIEEFFVAQKAYKAIERTLAGTGDKGLKQWWNDTKAQWNTKYGKAPTADDLYRAHVYRLLNGISDVKGSIIRPTAINAEILGKKQDEDGLPLHRPEGTEAAYWKMRREEEAKAKQPKPVTQEQGADLFKKMHEAVVENKEQNEAGLPVTKESIYNFQRKLTNKAKPSSEEEKLAKVALRAKQALEIKAIREQAGQPARSAGESPQTWEHRRGQLVGTLTEDIKDKEGNVTKEGELTQVRKIVNKVINRVTSLGSNRKTGADVPLFSEQQRKDIYANVVSDLQNKGIDSDGVMASAARRAREHIQNEIVKNRGVEYGGEKVKTISLDKPVGEGKTTTGEKVAAPRLAENPQEEFDAEAGGKTELASEDDLRGLAEHFEEKSAAKPDKSHEQKSQIIEDKRKSARAAAQGAHMKLADELHWSLQDGMDTIENKIEELKEHLTEADDEMAPRLEAGIKKLEAGLPKLKATLKELEGHFGKQVDVNEWTRKALGETKAQEEGLPQKEEGLFTTKAIKIVLQPPQGMINSAGAFNGNQLLGLLRNHLSPTEYSIYRDAGIEQEFGGGRNISKNDALKWLQQNTPKVEVRKFGEGMQKLAPEIKEYQDMTHSWFDSLPRDQRQLVGGILGQTQETIQEFSKFGKWEPDFTAKVLRYNELKNFAANYEYPTENRSHWGGIVAPKAEKDMPGYVEIAVVKNGKKTWVSKDYYDRLSPEKRVGYTTDKDEANSGQFPSSHNFPPNTLGFVRGYMETLPNGEKVFHVIEVQSDWAKIHEIDDPNGTYVPGVRSTKGKWYKTFDGKLFDDRAQAQAHIQKQEPLLGHYERLALKAAIEHARQEGATKIAISDAETAMMSEGHDTPGMVESYNTDLQGNPWPEDREIDPKQMLLKQRSKNDAGMRLHYDRTLPKIAEELTGSKGERAEMGSHGNAFGNTGSRTEYANERDAERFARTNGGRVEMQNNRWFVVHDNVLQPRKDLIFRNPDGTPKTSVTGRVYDLSQVSKKLDEGNKFTLLNKHQEEGLPKQSDVHGVTPEQRYNFLRAMPELDSARRKAGPEGRPIADALSQVPVKRDQYYGKYTAKLLELASKTSEPDKSKVLTLLYKEDATGENYRALLSNDKQRALYDAVRQALLDKQNDQIAAGEKVRDFDGRGKPFFRDAKINLTYMPSIMRPDVLDAILKRKGNYKTFEKQLTDYWVKQGATPEGAAVRLEALKNAGDASKPNMTRFGANRLSEGLGIPPELRVQDLDKAVSKYFNKVSTDRAWHDVVEKNQTVMNGLKNPEMAHVFHGIVDKIRGEPFEKDSGTIRALNRVFTSALLGPMTNIHIGWSTVFNPFQYVKGSELAGVYTKAMSHWSESARRTIENGYKRRDLNTVHDILNSSNTFIQRAQAVSSLIGKVNGREITDKISKTFAQALSEEIVPLRHASAKQGDAASQKLMLQLDPSWSKEKTYTPEEVGKLASVLGGFIHGAHDFRTLPSWATNDTILKPFVSLMSWSVSQTNQWMKHVYEPATKGNIEPLIMSTLGAVAGGYVIQQLRQEISDKKSAIPSLTEIANSHRGLEGNAGLLAYNFMQMASFTGFMGIGSTLAKDVFDMAYKNIPQGSTFPLDEAISNVSSTVAEATSAWLQDRSAENFFKIFPQMMVDLGKENVQSARIALNWMSDKGVATENENYKYKVGTASRDLRSYRMAEGLPYDQQVESLNNPYLFMGTKEFKRTEDMREAAKEVPALLQQAIRQSAGNPEVMRERFQALKQNSYQTMPSMEGMPLQFGQYYQYLRRTIGDDAAKARLQDYMRHNIINKMKAQLIPTL